MAEDGKPTGRVVKKRVVKKAGAPASDAPRRGAGKVQAKRRTRRPGGRKSQPKAKQRTSAPKQAPATPARSPTRRTPRIPQVAPPAALAASGAVVGLVSVGLTVLGMEVFEFTRGTSTGGGTWGLVGLAIVVVLSIGVGAFLLGSLNVSHPRLTALVGEILVLVVVLAFLLGVIYSAWMWLVIPVLTAAVYLGTHWLLGHPDG